MSQRDQDIEEFCRLLYNVADRLMVYQRIMSYPDCNTCGKRDSCRYVPKPGEQTRINCPLWKGKGDCND